ncbi:translocation/assembly module TamB, partial [Salinimicrobium sp. CDJ15-91]|nr:translocation/assembly module TamB [Salinimicrobium oceani]
LFLRESNFALLVTEENMQLRDLVVQLNGNRIEGNLTVNYDSLDQFIENPENATVDLNLPSFNLDLEEIYRFQPDLRQNEYFATLAKKGISGTLSAQGQLAAVNIENANINWGANTSLSVNGTIFNATDPDALRFDLPRVRFNSSGGDLRAFVEADSLGIQIPENMALTGSFSGTPENITADAVLNSSAGKIDVEGNFTSAPGLAFNADIKVTSLQVGEILQNNALGPITLNIRASGSGEDINSLDAVVEGTIDTLTYNNYKFENIALQAQLEDGEGFANIDYKD